MDDQFEVWSDNVTGYSRVRVRMTRLTKRKAREHSPDFDTHLQYIVFTRRILIDVGAHVYAKLTGICASMPCMRLW